MKYTPVFIKNASGKGRGGPRRDAQDVQRERARLSRRPPPRGPPAVGLPRRHGTGPIRRGPSRRRRGLPLGQVRLTFWFEIRFCVTYEYCKVLVFLWFQMPDALRKRNHAHTHTHTTIQDLFDFFQRTERPPAPARAPAVHALCRFSLSNSLA